ncbi:MAG: tetratricopeptide repeat protein, partial [Candidatus Schekmanbacteria bacterium]
FFFSINKIEAFETLKHFYSLFILYYAISYTLSIESIKKILSYSIHTAFLVSIIALIQTFTSEGFTLQETVTSTFGHSNILAQYLIAIFPFSFCRSIEKNMNYSYISLFEMPVIFAALMVTYCRGAWLGFGASLVLIFLVILRRKTLLVKGYSFKLFIFITVGIFLISIPILLKNPGVITSLVNYKKISESKASEDISYDAVSKSKTIRQRKAIWQATSQIIWENPIIGIGVGNFKIHIPKYMKINENSKERPVVKWAHNDLLQISAESGLLSAFVFILIIVRIFVKFFSVKNFEKITILVIPCGASAIATLVQSQTSFNFYQTLPSLFFFLSSAVIVNSEKMQFVDFSSKKMRYERSFLIFFIVFIMASALYFIKQPIAEIYYVKASISMQKSDWEKSKFYIEKCLSLNSKKGKYLYSAALASFALSDEYKAFEYAKRAKGLTPYVVDVLKLYLFSSNECGNLEYDKKNYDKAVYYYRESVKTFDELFTLPLTMKEEKNFRNLASIAYYNLGNTLMKKGDFKGARSAFENSLSFNPKYFPSKKALKEIVY